MGGGPEPYSPIVDQMKYVVFKDSAWDWRTFDWYRSGELAAAVRSVAGDGPVGSDVPMPNTRPLDRAFGVLHGLASVPAQRGYRNPHLDIESRSARRADPERGLGLQPRRRAERPHR